MLVLCSKRKMVIVSFSSLRPFFDVLIVACNALEGKKEFEEELDSDAKKNAAVRGERNINNP
jgi:hypothetical protein